MFSTAKLRGAPAEVGDGNVQREINRLVRSLGELADGPADSVTFRRALREAKGDLCASLIASGRPEPVAQLLALKLLNLLAGRRDFERVSSRVESRPLGLIVDPSNGCQLACPGCVHSKSVEKNRRFDWPSGLIPFAMMRHLLNEYGPYATHVYFYNYGEPLLNARTPEYITMAKLMLARTVVSTNLSLKKFDAEAYVLSGLDFLTLSIDGVTPDTYARYRRGGNLDLVLENVEKMVTAKRRLGRDTPLLNWQFLLFEHNRHEAERAVQLARMMGVNQITLAAPFSVSWDDPTIEVAAAGGHREILFDVRPEYLADNTRSFEGMVESDPVARAFEAAWRGDPDCDPQPPVITAEARPPCHWLYKNMVVDSRGRVMPCCAPPGRDYDIVYAELADDDAENDAFNSGRYAVARLVARSEAAFREAVEKLGLERPPHCASCTWGQGRHNVNIEPEAAAHHLKECTRGLLDDESCLRLGDW